MTVPALQVREVCRSFGSVRANDHISLQVAPGEIVGLLGPNGAGKSTLMRICAGLLCPQGGTAEVNGHTAPYRNAAARAQLGLVSTDLPIYGELTVREALRHQAALYGIFGKDARTAVEQGVEQYQLGTFADRRTLGLSTGMQQRLQLARAMVHSPRLLLLDEPTSGLDADIRLRTWEQLRILADSGVGILLCTHNLQEAATLCGTLHLLLQGAIHVSRSAEEAQLDSREIEDLYMDAVSHEPGAAAC